MDLLRKSVYVLMAFTLLSAPLLACTLPGSAMSQQDKECCIQMADQCGGNTQMDESHSCCTRGVSLGTPILHPTVKHSIVSVELVGHIYSAATRDGSTFLRILVTGNRDSSSKSPPGHTSILRI